MYVHANLNGKNVRRQYLVGSLSGALSLGKSYRWFAQAKAPPERIIVHKKNKTGGITKDRKFVIGISYIGEISQETTPREVIQAIGLTP